ncbi:efflux RND transporter periplasmic adaptor subunit [Aliifodinibius salicampi]|uniref:Efflux RND transporter periplasmic adaptor subunit n=1 Tax=Fodinibius salicampi TaxID=1920655 RepID=A0ABT3PYT5_9BACT|nr:efflux RND transporter periplasmic adaptor subunit [Fodinibius salicampi]MCW9713020.1 efflux RND transporter periplasmic adaptor subunit [Fodinibius salicampi]
MNKQLVLAGIVLFLLINGCAEEQQEPKEEVVKSVTVETKVMKAQLFERYLELVGSVEAQNDVRISAEVTGRVQEYYVDQGDQVNKGTPILKIDDSRLQREHARLTAQVQQTREQYERLKKVFEQDSVGSEMDLINAKTAYEQSQSALEAIEVDLQNTTVNAPFDATLEEIVMEEGEMASPGTVLLRLIGHNRLNVSAGVPSIYSDAVSKGDTAQVWFDFQQSDTLRLPINFVGQSIDPQARTFEIEIKLPPQGEEYKVDMISNIKIPTFRKDSAFVIGEEYVYKEGNENVVYVVAEDDEGNKIARMNQVKLGPSYKNNVVVSEGLSKDERLITVGSSFLQDAMRIKIVEEKDRNIVQEN